MLPSLILIPGLAGTAELFQPFLDVVPEQFPRRVISYPTRESLSYYQLLSRMTDELREERSMVLIAESFGGPLAVRFAADHPERVKAIILCASFIRLPRPPWSQRILGRLLFHLPVSVAALRRYLAGDQASEMVLTGLRNSLRHSRPSVLLARLHESFRVDCSEALSRCCSMPLLYLAGSEDRLMPRQAIDAIRAVRPDVMIATLNGPHMLLQTEPGACWRAIRQFLGAAGIIPFSTSPVAAPGESEHKSPAQ
jgi:pimeloyl-ACP methyl ester carboxylesterase